MDKLGEGLLSLGTRLILGITVSLLLSSCSITHYIVPSDDPIKTDPIQMIVTGNIPLILPSGNYTVSGNQLIIK